MNLNFQEGPQTAFGATRADIAIFGGAAGGGKTYAILLEPLRHLNNPKMVGVIFRRTAVQIRNPGGLWQESAKIYPLLGGHPKESTLEWVFPSGFRMKFAALEYDKDVFNWQGSQFSFLGLDELTHFSEYQVMYLLSRLRSASGVPGYVRASTNPDANSWVRKFIDYWIAPSGLAIPERAGRLRWFIRISDTIVWADSKEELFAQYGEGVMPKSATFIPSTLYDNRILMAQDPTYLSNLMALPRVERERLLGANWNVKASAGNIFRREWFPIVKAIPPRTGRKIRYWDRASTKPNPENKDPDWSRGLKLEQLVDGRYCITSLHSMRDTPGQVENLVRTTASQDGGDTIVGLEQDPGSAGASDIANMVRVLPGYQVKVCKPTKDKVTRARPASSAAENGLFCMLEGAWNEEALSELENFSEDLTGKDDIVDTLSGAYNALTENVSVFDST